MKIKFDDIENAFYFVSMGPRYGNQAILCKKTGKIFYISELGDSDDLPDDIEDPDKYTEIPHKNKLDLGQNLVMRFVIEFMPDDIYRVENIFKRKGAYSRFKSLLEKEGLLKEWYDYENKWRIIALKDWCYENKIDFVG
jgi:hypothetical protein